MPKPAHLPGLPEPSATPALPGPAIPALPVAYTGFLECFARGEPWKAHEALEGAWRRNRSRFYKGLILLASGFVHAGRGNAHGVGSQLAKAERELVPYAPAYLGQDVSALLELARHGRALAGLHPHATAAEWRALLPPPSLAPIPACFRGDEAELLE